MPRPTKPKRDQRTVQRKGYFTSAEAKLIDAAAKKRELPVAVMIRQLILEGIKR